MAKSLIEVNTQSILDISKEIEKLNSSMRTSLSVIAAKDKELHLKNLDQNKKEFNSQLEIISSIKPEKPKPVIKAPPLIEAPPPPPAPEKKQEEEPQEEEKPSTSPTLPIPSTPGGPRGQAIPGGPLVGGVLTGGGFAPIIGDSGQSQGSRPLSVQYSPFKGTTGRPRITSGFGTRWGKPHNGIDIEADPGTPLYAYFPGVVTRVGSDAGGYGNYIEWRDSVYGQIHFYGHMISPSPLRNGQKFDQGTQLGAVGSTGRSTGPHLHWEIGAQGSQINPIDWVNSNPMKTTETQKPKAEPAENKTEPQKLSAEPSKPKTIVTTVPQPQQTAQVIPNNSSRDVLQPVNNTSSPSSFSKEQLIFATV
jgi:murein DD-endopeptidase MepM/ murein hydrolase activator NlpD